MDISSHEDSIKKLFNKQVFGRFLSDRQIDKPGALNYELNALISYLKKGEIIVAINDSKDVIGLIGFHFSEWDTNVFQKRVAFLQYFIVEEGNVKFEREIASKLLDKFHEWVKDREIDVVIVKIDTQYFSPIFVLQQNGYILYETITSKSLDVTSDIRNVTEGIDYRFAENSDIESLREIALKNTFKKSHFYLDTNFSIESVELMYARWIENALNSKQKIVIIEADNKIAGVFIYDIVDYSAFINKKIAVWKSAFVDDLYRGKGIGLRLFKATLQACINDGVDIVDSTLVEKNIISQSFHDKLGFRLVNTLYTLHKWFD